MRFLLCLTLVGLFSCAHSSRQAYDELQVECPNGERVTVKVAAGALNSSKSLVNQEIRKACGLAD